MVNSPLKTLAAYLAGEFENPKQAAANPTWYVHLRLWQRLIPSLSNEQTYTFFLEQATVGAGKPPYRQRIFQLALHNSDTQSNSDTSAQTLQGEYFALQDPLKFRGAGTEAALLEGFSASELVSLPNSKAQIRYQAMPIGATTDGATTEGLSDYRFQAALPDGKLCSFDYAGQPRYVYLGFDIAPKNGGIELLTYDKGIDPGTGRGLWGALMGPFEMMKQKSF
ncbi:MAG: chromophore lyase CpcT/CpeT [Cyanobacteria bacterium P01_A01_bin.116]